MQQVAVVLVSEFAEAQLVVVEDQVGGRVVRGAFQIDHQVVQVRVGDVAVEVAADEFCSAVVRFVNKPFCLVSIAVAPLDDALNSLLEGRNHSHR